MTNLLERISLWAAVCALGTGVSGCGSTPTSRSSTESVSDNDQPTLVVTPTVVAVSPAIWHAGDTVNVIGARFIGPSEGTTLVRFGGQFKGDSGATSDVDMQVAGTYHAANKLTFVFEPDATFGSETGVFTGDFKVTNVSNSGGEADGDPADTQVTIGPSILVQHVWPVSDSCAAARITDTLNGNQLEMQLATSGLGSPPIAIDIAWIDVVNEAREQQASISDGTSTSVVVDPGTIADGEDPSEGGQVLYAPVTFSISAADASGHTLQRSVTVNVRQDYEVTYDGNSHIVQLFAPEPVTSCLPGGQTGTSFNYNESTSETKSRNVTLSGDFKVSVWIVSLGFGFSVQSGVSSTTSTSLTATHSVFPHWYGAFYRQTAQLEKTGQIYRYDNCGVRTHVGSAYVTDWTWAPGFNQEQTDCPPLPSPLMASDGSISAD